MARLVYISGSRDMWDLTVESQHDFYVKAGTAAVLVHNCMSFPRPTVQDDKLNDIVTNIYHGYGSPTQFATGGTGDAIRFEEITGQAIGGVIHAESKGPQMLNALSNWLRSARGRAGSPSDVHAAQGMLQDLIGAMTGY